MKLIESCDHSSPPKHLHHQSLFFLFCGCEDVSRCIVSAERIKDSHRCMVNFNIYIFPQIFSNFVLTLMSIWAPQ